MNKKVLVVAGLLIFLAIFWWAFQPTPAPVSTEKLIIPEPPEVIVDTVFYHSQESNESITVAYVQDQAILDGAGFEGLSLIQVDASSGARYVTSDNVVEIQREEDQVTVLENTKLVFKGQEQTVSEESEPAVQVASGTTTASSSDSEAE